MYWIVTNQGYGVVRIDGQVVFVPGLLKEEKARIKIVKVLKKYAFGKIEELQIVSKDRVEQSALMPANVADVVFNILPIQNNWI